MTRRTLDGRIGIFQGRLVPSTNGALQCSPGARWPEEFARAGELGLAHIELLAERVWDPANPMWSAEGRAALRDAATAAGVGLVSCCSEEPLDVPLADADAAEDLANRLVPVVADLGLDVVVLPMYEASDVSALPWEPVAAAVRDLAARLHEHGSRLVLELALPASECARFLGVVASAHVGLCYDVGNATALGLEPEREISELGSSVWHVHAKDKDANGANVRFGRGTVDFAAAFAALQRTGYGGRVTIEATRGDDPVATAAEHRAFLLALDRTPEPE